MNEYAVTGFALVTEASLSDLGFLEPLSPERNVIHSGGSQAVRKVADDLLHGSPIQFLDLFRMTRREFDVLVDWLAGQGLAGGRDISLAHKVMVFLLILGHNESQRNVAHRFLISQGTVSKLVQELLPAFVSLHEEFVKPYDDDWLDPIIELDSMANSFNGCIGAIDGTHIPALVPSLKQQPYRDRKGAVSQNVFAAVRFDGSFAYVLAGAEGSMNDSSILGVALGGGFVIPPHRYYIGDAGFGSRPGVVVPFSDVRYHLQDWRNAENPPETAKELYNLRHARLRVVVERAFGQLKRRFKIIRSSYSIDDQRKLIYAVTALHNFILRQRRPLTELNTFELEALTLARDRARLVVRDKEEQDSREIRKTAAETMWIEYKRYQGR